MSIYKNETIFKTDTFCLYHMKTGKDGQHDKGFWLWDETRQENIAMYASTEGEAFSNALVYYQKRLDDVEKQLQSLEQKAEKVRELFKAEEDE